MDNKVKLSYHKYTHILWQNELKFTTRIVKFMSENHETLESSEHFFVTPFYEVYDSLKEYGNIAYIHLDNPYSAEIINTVGRCSKWIFLHNICSPIELLKVHPKYIKRIIWRSWGGGGLSKIPLGENMLKNTIKKIINKEVQRRIHNFKIIGVANCVDVVELTKKFGHNNYMIQPYSLNDISEMLSRVENEHKTDETINVMIGHSGFIEDNHIQISKKLERFKYEKIKLFYPLSYGNDEYIEMVKKEVNNLWGDKAVFIDDFMPYEEYVKLLNKMDVVFLDAPYSYALGNVSVLVHFNKKLFLKKDGILAQAFDMCKTPYCTLDSLENINFDEFCKPIKYKGDNWRELAVSTSEQRLNYWECIIDFLNK